MPSDTPPDDDGTSGKDPWADLVAESLADDGDAGTFDFAAIAADVTVGPKDVDVEPVELAGDDPFADLATVGASDPFAALGDGVDDGGARTTLDGGAVAEDVVDVSEVPAPESFDAFGGEVREDGTSPNDDESLDGDLFAELVGGDDAHDDGSSREAVAATVTDGPFDVFEGHDGVEARDEGDGFDPFEEGVGRDFAARDVAADEAPALSVFSPATGSEDEASATAEAAEDVFGFGDGDGSFTGDGDVAHAGVAAADGDASPWDQIGEVTAGDESADGVAEDGGAEGFFAAPVGDLATAAVAAGPAARPAARPTAPKKKGGAGQIVGIVLGGLASIPIVLGLLIGLMWMGRPDPIGMRRWLPGASFLLPPVRQVARTSDDRASRPDGGGLDSLQGLAGLESSTPAPGPKHSDATNDGPSAFGPAPGDEPPGDVASTEMPARPAPPGGDAEAPVPPADDPKPPAADALAAIPAVDPLGVVPAGPMPPALGDLLATAPVAVAPPPPPEPEPLDLTGLDGAIDEASNAAAILAETAADDPRRKRHMIAWYRALARVAAEMVSLEALAVESGRPLDEAFARLELLAPTLRPDSPLVADLTRLARNWLSFARRDSDGVVLPVTFDSTRAVGPYWCTKVLLEEADGQTREVAVVSRQAPVAELGERCLVTGVIFDGGTVWAADVRSVDRPGGDALGLTPASEASLRPDPQAPEPATASPDAAASPKAEPPDGGAPGIEVPEVDPPGAPAATIEVPDLDLEAGDPVVQPDPGAAVDESASDAAPEPEATPGDVPPAPSPAPPGADF